MNRTPHLINANPPHNCPRHRRALVIWLLSGALLVFCMVVVGGITRLTHSGLSISDYKIISGTLPPLSEKAWKEAFELYKQYPEYQKLNSHFQLGDFKSIYFWEWLHRFIGRLIGLVFLIPFLYFILKKQLRGSLLVKTLILMGLGAFQGFLGWYMVKSGLVDKPDVSHYRLAAHLTTAFATFALILWIVLGLCYPQVKNTRPEMQKWLLLGMSVLFFQIVWGAFVAGLDAGFVHNHWPMMSEGKFIHETVFIEKSTLVMNFIEGRSGVQFIHRIGALGVVGVICIILVLAHKKPLTPNQKFGVWALAGLAGLQFLLGVFTLLLGVPLWLGLAHQIGAFFLLAAMTFARYHFKPHP